MGAEVREIAMKRLARDEKGQAMVMVLFLMVVGGLLVSSLLAYMGTGLLTGRVYERRTAELYAADAGVEDAVWKIQNNIGLCPGNPSTTYNITDVNGKSVEITVTLVNNTTAIVTYRVESTATGGGSGTKIDAYVTGTSKYGDYAGLLNQIITTQGQIDEQGKQYLNYTQGNGPVENYTGAWPTPSELKDFYWQDVKNTNPYLLSTLDVKDYTATGIGPFYRNGAFNNKGIVNTGASGLTLKLNGTVYITGDTEIGTGQQDFTLDLNGNTIFVSSNTSGSQKALNIGTHVSIKGPGCIIAIGDIYFEPKAQVTTDPVFVLSVSGQTLLQPGGNIYGAIAGSVEVQLQPNTHLTYPTGGFEDYDLNFLSGIQALVYSIDSWEVSQQ
jgi:hypothetical protein